MQDSALHTVRRANSKLQTLLQRAADALAGRRDFGVEDVRAMAEPVAEMAPIVSEARHLREAVPELHGELDIYAKNLGQLQTALDRVRVVLLARCAHLEAQRGHLETLGLWAAAWRKTQ
jgi:hypothetical protein